MSRPETFDNRPLSLSISHNDRFEERSVHGPINGENHRIDRSARLKPSCEHARLISDPGDGEVTAAQAIEQHWILRATAVKQGGAARSLNRPSTRLPGYWHPAMQQPVPVRRGRAGGADSKGGACVWPARRGGGHRALRDGTGRSCVPCAQDDSEEGSSHGASGPPEDRREC